VDGSRTVGDLVLSATQEASEVERALAAFWRVLEIEPGHDGAHMQFRTPPASSP
jgi:hypothetical protein